jgi:hypothetical protein
MSAFEDITLDEKELSGAELFVVNKIMAADARHAVKHKAEYASAPTDHERDRAMNGCAICRAFPTELRLITNHKSNLVTTVERVARELSLTNLAAAGGSRDLFEDWWTHVLTESTRDGYRTTALRILRILRLAWPLEEDDKG